jgi:hypothetical protein
MSAPDNDFPDVGESSTANWNACLERMRACGWEESSGRVRHADLGMTFPTWWEAVLACIEVASECGISAEVVRQDREPATGHVRKPGFAVRFYQWLMP